MPKPKKKDKDPSKYVNYQFAFRVKDEQTLKALQNDLNDLYEKFNKGRDPHDPKGVRAVKINDIAFKAIQEGLKEVKKLKVWNFEEND